jgi:hypothetical protein
MTIYLATYLVPPRSVPLEIRRAAKAVLTLAAVLLAGAGAFLSAAVTASAFDPATDRPPRGLIEAWDICVAEAAVSSPHPEVFDRQFLFDVCLGVHQFTCARSYRLPGRVQTLRAAAKECTEHPE